MIKRMTALLASAAVLLAGCADFGYGKKEAVKYVAAKGNCPDLTDPGMARLHLASRPSSVWDATKDSLPSDSKVLACQWRRGDLLILSANILIFAAKYNSDQDWSYKEDRLVGRLPILDLGDEGVIGLSRTSPGLMQLSFRDDNLMVDVIASTGDAAFFKVSSDELRGILEGVAKEIRAAQKTS